MATKPETKYNEQQLIDEGYTPGKKSFESIAKEINETFDWETVHKTMMALNWCWSMGMDESGKDRMGIPDVTTIKNSAWHLLKKVYDAGKGSTSTCGFSAGWDGDYLYLVFTIEETAALAKTA
jgi:hypothetical protein